MAKETGLSQSPRTARRGVQKQDVPVAAPKKRRGVSGPGAPLYALEITLVGVKPRVWRRVRVPGDANLGWLHAVIQVAMGWTNSHLHQFTVGKGIYSEPSFDLDDFDGPKLLDENKTTLMEVAPRNKAAFRYEYDFGDSWMHRIRVERILEPDPAGPFAKCLDGARACPPEDCGGIGGYADLLEIIKDPSHDQHETLMEWLCGEFDPEAFDIEKVNTYLRKLKWPRTTVPQLATILMARDGYRG